MHLCEPLLSGAPHAYFGGVHPRVHRVHRLNSAAIAARTPRSVASLYRCKPSQKIDIFSKLSLYKFLGGSPIAEQQV